jgi:hypothetical protein
MGASKIPKQASRPSSPFSFRARFRLSLGVVEQAVMAQMEAAWDGKACAHFNRYPVPELKPLLMKERPKQHVPFRQIVEGERQEVGGRRSRSSLGTCLRQHPSSA